MSKLSLCPHCGCEMPPDSPGGLCPACLLGLGVSAANTEDANTEASWKSGFVPPDLADRLPQFEILELLGFGGMGAVYKARQKSLDRLVALKIIKPDAAEDRGFAERFAREAKALAKLNHAAIVGIHDFGVASGLFYLVMEYVDGTNLRRLMEARELPAELAIRIVPQICEALQFAHDEGIVHRDIKPENILVDAKGRVKIADFGLAKLLDKSAVENLTLTDTQQVMGTPRYMAPEQMQGSKSVDHRADIYSLGVVFYEMLTGELPMGSFEPPSRKVQLDVRLDEVVLRTLAKEPARRYQHASDVKSDVEAISHERHDPVAPAHAIIDWTPLPVGTCLILPLLALIAFGMWYTTSSWVLGLLFLPWFGLGVAGVLHDSKPTERAINVLALITFLGCLALIALGIWLEQSAWPLVAIAVGIAGACGGMMLGVAASKHADDDSPESPEPAEHVEQEQIPSRESLEMAAWFVGLIGAARSWALVSTGGKAFDSLVSGESFAVNHQLLLQLTGPVALIAGIAIYHARFYWLAVVGAVLCLPTGNWLPVLLGIFSLATLFDTKVRAMFVANELALKVAAGGTGASNSAPPLKAKPPLPDGSSDALGGRLNDAWTKWWRERDGVVVRSVQLMLMLLHITCLLAFLSFSGRGTTNAEGQRVISHKIGLPSPWFTMETTSGDGFSFNHVVHFSSSAWLVAASGFGLAYIHWRIAKATNPEAGFWHKPDAFLLVWSILALADIGLAAGMTHMMTQFNQPEKAATRNVIGEHHNSLD